MQQPFSESSSPSIIAQVTDLPSLTLKELKDLWLDLFGTAAPTRGRLFIQRRIAFKIQENAMDRKKQKLANKNSVRLDALLEQQKLDEDVDVSDLPLGTVLSRRYKGHEYLITILPNQQFQCEGKVYGSLSEAARDITGTAWNGPLFFGLRKRNAAKKSKR